jgi:L-alanine-DL-glutamate epimerase-like enolase superfamily enzyme
MNRLSIDRLDIHGLDAPLLAPFTTAASDLARLQNLAIQVTLSDGTVGWGETPILYPITVEDRPTALAALRAEAELLPGREAIAWRRLAAELSERIPELAAVRAGIEMALLDALTRHWRVALYQFFGGWTDSVTTDITIPIGESDQARRLAQRYRDLGFDTLKVKIGLDVDADIHRLLAVKEGHPACRLVVDANAGYTVEQTFAVLAELRRAGITPALLEQPVARDDWDGLGRLAREAGVPVAADESCRTPADVLRIAHGNLAQVINIKLAKFGVVQALEMVAIARAAGLGLMIGGMVESRIAMGFGAHFAAGLGGFSWVDLDTPLLLAADPVVGGYSVVGALYRLAADTPGHGAELRTGTPLT